MPTSSSSLRVPATALLALGAVLGSAGCGDGGDDGSAAANVLGKLRVFQPGVSSSGGQHPSTLVQGLARQLLASGSSAAVRHQALRSDTAGLAVSSAAAMLANDFVPGELVLSFREGGAEDLAALSRLPGLTRYRFSIRTWGGPAVAAVRIVDDAHPLRTLSSDETLLVRERVARHPSLRAAELNHLRGTHLVPNDSGYAIQWHYPRINLPAAWDQTTGAASVVVAVIDDGVRPHPELATRLLPGYDMISEAAIGGDGDGRDADPSEVAYTHGGQSVWHGTHVAGTIGASGNNGDGVAGVDWRCKIVPIRVLGVVQPSGGAGTDIDILAGMYWSVGVEVPGVPVNPNPAQVVNMSLGGGALTQAGQDAVNEMVARGAVVVVAAGNDNLDAQGRFLAGYDNVIVVGAIDQSGGRAPYSNFGAVVDVVAPGGNVEADVNADGRPDGVLSTYLDQTGTQYAYEFLQGTSMASPHVAGVAALMKAARPGITPAQIEQVLKQTADPGGQCPEGCGAGLINAAAAVQAASGVNVNAPAKLALSTDRLNLGSLAAGQLTVFNAGGGTLGFSAALEGAAAASVAFEGASSGSLGASGSAGLSIRVDRAGLSDGVKEAAIVVTAGGQQVRAKLLFTVGAATLADIGAVAVGTFSIDDTTGKITVGGETQATAKAGYSYGLSSRTGRWLVVAIADRNGNGDLDQGDYFGLYESTDNPKAIDVGTTAITAIDFALVPYSAGSPVEAVPCAAYRACIEQCGSSATCQNGCAVGGSCQTCLTGVVQMCGAQAGCGSDLTCLCASCSAELDACFGPLSCGSSAGGTSGAAVGAACGSCEAGLVCDGSVAGGYCTRDCFADGVCPSGGSCVRFDQNMDGTADQGFCFATCSGAGSCPRSQDTCTAVAGVQVCVPG